MKICSIETCDDKVIASQLCRYHYRHRDDKPRRAFAPGKWGKWKIMSNGYNRRRRTVNGKLEFQLEHRVVMEEMIGRKLLKHENVHHKNGVRNDNRPENLELWVSMQPAGQRPEDLVRYAKEILALYGSE